jgi:hypothetical protein
MNQQDDLNLGGNWDNSIGHVSKDIGDWITIAKKARSAKDMRPMRMTNHCCSNQGCVNSLERMGNEVNCVNEVSQGASKWEKVTVTVDSGAVDSVGPPTMAKDIRVRETPASRAGMKYRAANGTSIANQGEKSIQGVTKEGRKIGMSFQIANVTKPLGAVRAMLDAGNRVVFDRPNSYIMNKASKAVMPIEERNGAFVFDIWMPRNNKEKNIQQVNRYQILADNGDDNEDFARPDDLMA